MNYQAKSIRTFIGAKDYQSSRTFYQALGFEEVVLFPKMSLFKVNENLAFYLQDYYAKEWCDNSMVFLEVDDLDKCWKDIQQLHLPKQYKNVKLSTIQELDWGREFFLHDPAGVLWHFGVFN